MDEGSSRRFGPRCWKVAAGSDPTAQQGTVATRRGNDWTQMLNLKGLEDLSRKSSYLIHLKQAFDPQHVSFHLWIAHWDSWGTCFDLPSLSLKPLAGCLCARLWLSAWGVRLGQTVETHILDSTHQTVCFRFLTPIWRMSGLIGPGWQGDLGELCAGVLTWEVGSFCWPFWCQFGAQDISKRVCVWILSCQLIHAPVCKRILCLNLPYIYM